MRRSRKYYMTPNFNQILHQKLEIILTIINLREKVEKLLFLFRTIFCENVSVNST